MSTSTAVKSTHETASGPIPAFDVIRTPISKPMLLEASAGTGKTYSLMHVLLRLLVEKELSLKNILVVTFTNAAAFELSSRLRKNLTEILEKLSIITDPESYSGDPVVKEQLEVWSNGTGEGNITLSQVKERVQKALSEIDDAAIFTIHGFCQRMLQDYVFSSKGNYDFNLGDDTEAKEKAVNDFLRANLPKSFPGEAGLQLSAASAFDWNKVLEKVSKLSTGKSLISQIKPMKDNENECAPEIADFFYTFVREAYPAFVENKKEERIFTFDDLLTETEAKVINEAEFVQEIRKLFSAALIDEFQDTDPVQYSIFRRLFLQDEESEKPVIFVGDPKQSIYKFRNADLDTYLQAKNDINNTYELTKNFRSTPGIIEGVNAFFGNGISRTSGGAFLNPKLTYSSIDFNKKKLPLLKKDGDKFVPLSSFAIWSNFQQEPKENADENKNTEAVAIAEEIVELLSQEVYFEGRRLRPSDIAVLVCKRKDADELTLALKERNIRYLKPSSESITGTKEAEEIKHILEAMADPRNTGAVALAESTKVFGKTLNNIMNDDASSAEVRLLLEKAIKTYENKGIIAAFSLLFAGAGTEERLLSVGGERALTNYQHILELLYEQRKQISTIQGLLRWWKEEIRKESHPDGYNARRETDKDVVRIETVHASKGLQYPVVFYLDRSSKKGSVSVFDDPNGNGVIFKEKKGTPPDAVVLKEDEEKVRLLYVAMTRATSRLVVPFFIKTNKDGSIHGNYGATFAIAKSLTGSTSGGSAGLSLLQLKDELSDSKLPYPNVVDKVREALSEGLSSAEPHCLPPGFDLTKFCADDYQPFELKYDLKNESILGASIHVLRQQKEKELSAGTGEKQDQVWRTSSFSGLLKSVENNESLVISDESETTDQVDVEVEDTSEEDILEVLKGKQNALEFGTKIHELLEKIFGSNFISWKETVGIFINERINVYLPEVSEARKEEIKNKAMKLFEDLLNCKPLPTQSEFSLHSLLENGAQKRPEMEFLLSVGSPVKGREPFTAKRLSETLAAFDKDFEDLQLSDQDLKGYLTGSIDLAFKAGDRFWILDWKTNKIDYQDNHPKLYTKESVASLMKKDRYGLQLTIYLIALKRILEQRFNIENGYDRIGGALYCFLRGINASGRGTYYRRPSRAMITCLDDFLMHGFSANVLNQAVEEQKIELSNR